MIRFAIVDQLARAALSKLSALQPGGAKSAEALEKTARRLLRGSAGTALLPGGGLGAFGAGLALGAGLGLLLAPKSGAELRAALVSRFRRGASAETEPRPLASVPPAAGGSARQTGGGNGAG